MTNTNLSPEPYHSERYTPEEMQFSETGQTHWRLTIRTTAWRPPTDVYETDEAVIVRVEIAGMCDDDFTIELDGRNLSIHGTRPDAAERRAYHQMEIRFGEFSSEFELPVQVIPEQVQAVYDNGFLRVTLPKARPRQIHIEEIEG
jgi:HSP20 family protein